MPPYSKIQPPSQRLAIICTARCNFQCPHCIRQLYYKKAKAIDLPPSLFKICLEEFKKINYRNVAFTGGESILHPRFKKLISLAVEANYTFSVISNGWFYQDYFPIIKKYAHYLTAIDFSLDGSTEYLHDGIRNKPGSFRKVIEAIKFYKKQGFRVAISTCFNQTNLFDAKNIYKLISSLSVDNWRILGMIDIVGQNPSYNLSDEDRLFLSKEILPYKKKEGAIPNIELCTGAKFQETNIEINFCNALSSRLTPAIYPDGSMLFCCDIYKECISRPNIEKEGFWPSFKMNLAAIEKLKLQRINDIIERNFFDGFNSCNYCNRYIESILDDLRENKN